MAPTHKPSSRLRLLLAALALGGVIVLLLLIVAPRCCPQREPGPATVLKGELRRITTAQEMYYARSGSYGAVASLSEYRPAEGVVLVAEAADEEGWTATIGHPESGVQCSRTVTLEGLPASTSCTGETP